MSLPKFSVENPVLVNLLMVGILVAGVYTGLTMVREMFPESRPNQIMISTVYPGATPEEVEKGIAIRIEEEIKSIEYIDKIETRISEGLSILLVSLTNDVTDLDDKVNEFKAAVDAIPRDELPEESETTRVQKFEPRLPVISVALHGAADEFALKAAGRQLRDDLLRLEDITDVELAGTRKDELAVEVCPEKLIEYQLSLAQVSDAIRRGNLDLPGGQVKTVDQNVAVRTLGETDEVELIADTIIRTGSAAAGGSAGDTIRVRDVARVVDGFEDSDLRGRFNGQPAVDVTVYQTSDQDAIEMAARVKAFVAGKQGQPLQADWLTRLGVGPDVERIWDDARRNPYSAGLTLELHSDLSRYVTDRLDLLERNGLWGLLLVFLALLLTLNWRVAFWVMMGLVLSLCGGIVLMSLLGATLNLISMFGLIVVLGLIVDDAIVVGENIYARVERGEDPRTAAVDGANEVSRPVIVAVATTIGAFFPLMFIEGRMGDFMGVLPIVVMSALIISLVEALMILPCHLADTLQSVRRDLSDAPPRHWLARLMGPLREKQQYLIQTVLAGHYERLLRLATRYRYVTVAAACSLLLMSLGLVAGGHVEFVMIQAMDSETLLVNLEMPVGTPAAQTETTLSTIEELILDERQFPEVKSSYTLVGAQIQADEGGATASARSHLGQIIVELASVEQRERQSTEIVAAMRVAAHGIVGINALKFSSVHGGPAGAEIEVEITGAHIDSILAAAGEIKQELARHEGVHDIDDDYERGRRELQITMLDSARSLGLTTQALATELRGAFFGLEARTLQRDREDVDIRVRFPEERRRNVYELDQMRITTASGAPVPLCEVARIEEAEGTAAIRRIDQRRAVVVVADVDQAEGNASEIIAGMSGFVVDLEHRLPGVQVEFAGNKRETAKSMGSLRRDFVIVIVMIFIALAWLFKSYLHPLVVLMAVPFGVTGAVVGHYIMGYPLTILSMIGLVALTGIVVNDALILVDFTNKEAARGKSLSEAVISAGRRRLRPIILTSLTTILGLAPLMAEQSFQARFLIPMAISISFGLAFSTALTLLVVPSLYLIANDLKSAPRRLWYGPGAEGRSSFP